MPRSCARWQVRICRRSSQVNTSSDLLSAATEELSRFLIADATLGETLERVARLALASIHPAEAVGVTLLEGRRTPITVFASDTVANTIDQAQYDDDAGPCLDA